MKICMVTANNLDYDTRILNEAKTLAQVFDLTIITSGCSVPNILKNPLFQVKKGKTISFGPRDFKRVINLWPLFLAVWRESPDIFHAHDLPGLLCAWLPAVIKGKILIYDSHELWSDITLFGLWKIFRWPFRLLERVLSPKIKAIITVNESIAQILKKRYHKPTLAIYNYADVGQKAILTKNALLIKSTERKIILYIGALQPGRGLNQIIKSAEYLDDSFQFLLIGYGPERDNLEREITKRKLNKKIKLLPPLPSDQVVNIIRKAQVGLCLIENVSLSYYLSSPNKLFQYIAAEVPILASNFPEYRRIVSVEKIGEVVDPASSRQIAQKIIMMVEPKNHLIYTQNLKNLAQKKYNWQLESQKLIKFYLDLTTTKRNILIDINHPAHVHFFKNLIWELQYRGHKVLVTASQKEMTQELLDNYHIPYVNMGSYGNSIWEKVFKIPVMLGRMFKVCLKFKPDIFLGIASSRAAQTAFILRKPCYLFDDTAYCLNVWLYLPFVTKVYTPDCFKIKLGHKQVRYPGYHQLASLHPKRFHPDPTVLKKCGLSLNKRFFIIRFISWKAAHDIFSHGFSDKGKKKLIRILSKYGQPIITSEAILPKELEMFKMKIPPEQIHHLLYYADLVVSEGGTMASEAAVLGTPAFFVSSLLADTLVEQSQKYGLISTFHNEGKALVALAEFVKKENLKSVWRQKRDKMIQDKIDVTKFLIDIVEKENEKIRK